MTLRRILIPLIAVPAAISLLAVVAIAAILAWPTIVINPTTLLLAARQAAVLGVAIEWKAVRVGAESHGVLDKTISIAFDDLCVHRSPELEQACFAMAELSARGRFEGIRPRIAALGPVALSGGQVVVRPPTEKNDDGPAVLAIPRIEMPEWFTEIRLFPIDLAIDAFEVGDADASVRGELTLTATPDENGALQFVAASGTVAEGKGGRRASFTTELTSASRFTKGDWGMTAKVDAELGPAGKASLAGDLSSEDGRTITPALTFSYAGGGIRGDLSLSGAIREDELEAVVQGTLDRLSEVVPKVAFSNCRLTLKRTDVEKNRGALAVACPVTATLKSFALPGEIDPIYRPPKSLRVNLTAKADTCFLPDLGRKISGTLSAQVEPVKSQLVRMRGGVEVAFSGVPSAPLARWKAESTADVDFIIEDFSKLVDVFAATRWPVPAPFNVLTGSIEFSLEGRVSSVTRQAHIPATLTARLTSKEQRIFAESRGELTMGLGAGGARDATLDLDVALTDVQLQLPDLALASIPRFVPDKRIRLTPAAGAATTAKKSSPAPSLAYRIHIATPAGQPVRILSNITPTFIPVALDLDLDDAAAAGTVSITDFPVELFRRKGKVERFVLTLRQPSESSEISAAFSIPYTDYTIRILLAGTVEDPVMTLESTPPLSQGDIISTLLYGEPMDALDVDSASSVGSMSAAIADRGLALTSMFVLASTPIQSVGYNPATKTFSARIKLGKKTSLVVGSQSGSQQVGIRQRLGKGWSINTSYERTTSSSSGAATAYIEWTKRY